MTLGRQWDERLNIWDEALSKEYFTITAEHQTEGFVTKEASTLSEAKAHAFTPFPAGTEWGAKWEYGWFRTTVVLTEREEGQRVLIHLGVGPEMLVFVNGKAVGSIDKKHSFVELTPCGRAGESFEILTECYAGHGVRREEGGIFDKEAVPVPEPGPTQVKVAKTYTGIFDAELFSAYMDFHTLYGLLKILSNDSLRAIKIAEGLKDFTYIADMEAERKKRRELILEAAKRLISLLEKKNGDTVPEYTIFGQSHLDLAWLWTENETRRKVARTYSNQLSLLKRYAEQSFLVCEPILLEYLKDYYPDLFDEVVKAVKDGRFFADGATYVESDTNLISGESMIRQFLWGKRWYKTELDTDSKMLWLPDTFGFSGAMPQIMKECRIDWFATQKLLRCDPECEQFPYTNFWWEGIDGTKILSHIYKKNNCNLNVAALDERFKADNRHNDDMEGMIFPYGFGDGGGGATEEMTETLKRCRDLEGLPRCTIESPAAYFEKLSKHNIKNTYFGELYLAWHRGTYTVQSALKKGNRRAEFALRDAEMLLSLLMLEGKADEQCLDTAKQELRRLWRLLLSKQFHDILAGSSIEQVNIEAKAAFEEIINSAETISKQLLKQLAGSENAAFNSLGWTRKAEGAVLLPVSIVTDCSDKTKLEKDNAAFLNVTESKADNSFVIENEYYTATINSEGRITSLVDAVTGFEYVENGKALNTFRLYRDVNTCYDAWELGRMYADNEEIPPYAKITGFETEEGKATLKLLCEAEYFTIRQDIRFYADDPRIDFVTEVDWRERHKLLKVDFPTGIYTKELYSEIQFGCIKRPTHKSGQREKDLYEFSQHKYSTLTDGANGLAVLNDCKYGLSAEDSRISLSLLRAPVIPDMHADIGEHSFTYSVLPYHGAFVESNVVEEGYRLNTEPVFIGDKATLTGKTGSSYFATGDANVVLETVKPAEDCNKAIIVRVYEAVGRSCSTYLELPKQIKKAYECNMLEEKGKELEIHGNRVELGFTPFKVKSIYLEF